MAMTHAAGQASATAGTGGAALFAGAGWPLVVLIWAAFSLATALNGFPGVIDKLSTDDAMRLVEVRDLLAGQGWFDLVQHRLNPPDGVQMHWSRVIDLPIALMLSAFGAFFSDDLTTSLTITVWPALLFLPALLAAASASRTLAGPTAGVMGAFMMVLSPGVATRYSPASIDHHGAQIALALILLACALKLDRSVRAGVGAGVAAALMMAIGMETAPHVAAAAAVIALRWAFTEDDGMARGAAAFGLSFALGSALVAVATIAPENWLAPVCDAFGIGHMAVAAIGGVGLFAAARHAGAGVAARLAALAQVGVAVAASVLIVAPNCLSSPYGSLPEKLKIDWLDRVQEAQTIIASTISAPTSGLAIGLPLLMLVGVAVWALLSANREERWRVATAVVMTTAACAVTVWQIRGASLAFALGGPLLPVAVLAIGRGGGRLRTGLAFVALCPASLALAGLGLAQAAGLPPIEVGASRQCAKGDYRALDRLPEGLVLNTTDTGPFILAFSRQSVVAAPYHRNVDGLMAELEAFQGSEETARAIAISRGARYVVICLVDGGARPTAQAYPNGFAALLMTGRPPAWLEPIDLGAGATLRGYRVLVGR